MKNLFLMLAFMLVGNFAFANDNEIKMIEVTAEYKKVVDSEGFTTCYVRHCVTSDHPNGNGGTREVKICGDWKRVKCPTREARQLA